MAHTKQPARNSTLDHPSLSHQNKLVKMLARKAVLHLVPIVVFNKKKKKEDEEVIMKRKKQFGPWVYVR
jgi:hypothetical protein